MKINRLIIYQSQFNINLLKIKNDNCNYCDHYLQNKGAFGVIINIISMSRLFKKGKESCPGLYRQQLSE